MQSIIEGSHRSISYTAHVFRQVGRVGWSAELRKEGSRCTCPVEGTFSGISDTEDVIAPVRWCIAARINEEFAFAGGGQSAWGAFFTED